MSTISLPAHGCRRLSEWSAPWHHRCHRWVTTRGVAGTVTRSGPPQRPPWRLNRTSGRGRQDVAWPRARAPRAVRDIRTSWPDGDCGVGRIDGRLQVGRRRSGSFQLFSFAVLRGPVTASADMSGRGPGPGTEARFWSGLLHGADKPSLSTSIGPVGLWETRRGHDEGRRAAFQTAGGIALLTIGSLCCGLNGSLSVPPPHSLAVPMPVSPLGQLSCVVSGVDCLCRRSG